MIGVTPFFVQSRLEPTRLRRALADLPLPRAADGRIDLAVDVSHWLRPDAPTSDERLFCHVYGRGDRSTDQFVPGWPYSFIAPWSPAARPGSLSWTRSVWARRTTPPRSPLADSARSSDGLTTTGHWRPADPEILIVMACG
ncbi:transposase [Streptomyces sp. TX20-6-3]|uniref:transposase n=1 Tax=Streptomyces sp. TX20-6-3 TaxID=3028705 RepID=UPI0034DEE892